MSQFRVGVDVGGTFTDLVLYDEVKKDLWVNKVPSSAGDQTKGILTGLTEILHTAGASPEEILSLAQGSTIAINALLEGKTSKVGIIATQGFRDLLELRRQRRPSLYDLFFQKPQPLVPRELRLEVAERVNSQGEILQSLDEQETILALKQLVASGVESIAVCFLFSFLNPQHELRVEELAKQIAPDHTIWLSHRVLPEFREFERLSTTVCHAALGPVMRNYLNNLRDRMGQLGNNSPIYIMQSNGGITSPLSASERPGNTLFSGPSAGVIGGLHVGRLVGTGDLITLDMGGTSTDVCLITNGAVSMVAEKEIAGNPIRTPMVDVNSVGAGGGSIAWIDTGGRIKVGPKSAGANPGPVSYGQGGLEPTVTDANLVLGRIGEDGLLGGRMPLYRDLAVRNISEKIAKPLGLTTVEAAWGIIQIVNTNIVLATRAVSVQQGYDPRNFALVGFGGAAPLHANAVAKQLGISKVIFPPSPGILCALGLLATDMRTDYVQTLIAPADQIDLRHVNRLLNQIQNKANSWLKAEGISKENSSVEISVDLRYMGQNYELTVNAGLGPWTKKDIQALIERFHKEHERAYGFRSEKSTVQMVNIRATALAAMPQVQPLKQDGSSAPQITPFKYREAWWDSKFVETPVFRRSDMLAGTMILGPAIIEQMDSTLLIGPGEKGLVDPYMNLILSL